MLRPLSILLSLILGVMGAIALAEPPAQLFSPSLRLSAGPDLSQSPAIKAKKPVVIYFANDVQTKYTSGFGASLRALTNALDRYETDESSKKYLVNLAVRLLTDIDAFNDAVDKERDVLVEGLCRPGALYDGSLIVFRNYGNTAIEDEGGWHLRVPYEYCHPNTGSGQMIRKTMNLALLREFRFDAGLAAQPLSSGNALDLALRTVRTTFPESEFRYVLIVKSRADAEHLLLPWFEGLVNGLDPNVFARALLEARPWLTQKDGVTPLNGMELYRPLNLILKKYGGTNVLLTWLSTEKVYAMEQLASLGGGDPARGMYFTLMLADTPEGELEISPAAKLQKFAKAGDYAALNIKNIGTYHTRLNTDIGPLPYNDLFGTFGLLGNRTRDIHDRLNLWLGLHAKGNMP